ncbi:MAG TPA: serine hydrolase [Stackebrandtia sp.]|jgi:beta-lactamase class A|uniref:serine hydrolase n=1 Tax=Stackebrandtia sp. TaxID=2023065 RepID=UPI002D4E1633|nr:serine hydrolase [Stackebrandtia sp.]HZE41863.1 serine hydrolase [Stackebrandtia sp.]
MKRRTALKFGLGAGAVATAGAGVGAAYADGADSPDIADAKQAAKQIARIFDRETSAAGGTWHAHITVADTDGSLVTAVDQDSATTVEAMSTNKLPVAVQVMTKVDGGKVALSDKMKVEDPYIVWDGDGLIPFDGSYPSEIILGHTMSLMLSISEDSSSRLCAQVSTADEINKYLTSLGYTSTQLEPVPDTPRWYLGTTSAKEMHDFWQRLISGKLLSAKSSEYLLKILRCAEAFHEGIRHQLPTPKRSQIATKAGWGDQWRNEAGVIYNAAGVPIIGYAMYASSEDNQDDFSVNHPLIAARSKMGRRFYDIAQRLDSTAKVKLKSTDVQKKYHPGRG